MLRACHCTNDIIRKSACLPLRLPFILTFSKSVGLEKYQIADVSNKTLNVNDMLDRTIFSGYLILFIKMRYVVFLLGMDNSLFNKKAYVDFIFLE